MRNLDRWTVHGFQKLVEQGITELATAVADGSRSVAPWRRRGGNVGGKLDDADVGYSISTSPVKRPAKSCARTTKCKA